ncbi:hypothetical protein EVAR_48658_1 [Eumeta japonica]|uniref:Uncharacterized protein n=1 Tax=Eumeta variegata TaxID=151549 RepID=A0A4C1X9H6_EUMVA|nr:hypothetical protein EVAR_48658_1 [Eumeta japonica]
MLFSEFDPGPYRKGRRYLTPVNDKAAEQHRPARRSRPAPCTFRVADSDERAAEMNSNKNLARYPPAYPIAIRRGCLCQQESYNRLRLPFHDEAPSLATFYNWFIEFERDRTDNLTEDLREGCSSTATSDDIVSAVRLMIKTDLPADSEKLSSVHTASCVQFFAGHRFLRDSGVVAAPAAPRPRHPARVYRSRIALLRSAKKAIESKRVGLGVSLNITKRFHEVRQKAFFYGFNPMGSPRNYVDGLGTCLQSEETLTDGLCSDPNPYMPSSFKHMLSQIWTAALAKSSRIGIKKEGKLHQVTVEELTSNYLLR